MEDRPVSHDQCWDEGWGFDTAAPEDFNVTAFCNLLLPIADYKELNFGDGPPLELFLKRYG